METGIEIEFKDVWKHFPGNEQPTLSGLNLVCKKGDINVIIGYSGTGKSVTIKHLLGLMTPDQGEVWVKSKNMSALKDVEKRDLRNYFGMLFQSSALFDGLNVFDNIAFPIREHNKKIKDKVLKDKVFELLEQVDLEGSHFKMPSELSGGMKKRVGLARAIALNPDILICDEPTTGLDPVTSRLIDQLIVKTTKSIGATAFIISHDIHAAVDIADSITMLHGGKNIATHTPGNITKTESKVLQEFLDCAGVERKS